MTCNQMHLDARRTRNACVCVSSSCTHEPNYLLRCGAFQFHCAQSPIPFLFHQIQYYIDAYGTSFQFFAGGCQRIEEKTVPQNTGQRKICKLWNEKWTNEKKKKNDGKEKNEQRKNIRKKIVKRAEEWMRKNGVANRRKTPASIRNFYAIYYFSFLIIRF